MSDDLPDLSKFDKYLDDEDLEEMKREKKAASGGSGGGTPGGGGKKGKSARGRPRRLVWLVAGLVLGVAGTLFLPDLLRPYLPAGLRLGETEVPGLVVEKRREGDRLLLTVDTERGASLATFTRQVSEIDLLVSEGDSVTLGLGEYAPLVDDPSLVGVRKGRGGAAPPPERATPADADTAAGPSTEDTAPAAGASPDASPGAADPDTTGG